MSGKLGADVELAIADACTLCELRLIRRMPSDVSDEKALGQAVSQEASTLHRESWSDARE